LVLAVGFWAFLKPQTAQAHPLGNFTVNRYSRLEIYEDQVRLRYVLDMAEIPTFQEMSRLDLNRDGQVDDAEGNLYASTKAKELRPNLRMAVNDKTLELVLVPQSPEVLLLPGQAGLKTLRWTAWFKAALPQQAPGQQLRVVYQDDNYRDRLGWKEIVVRPSNKVFLLQSSAPSHDISNELLSYPQDLLKSPSDLTRAEFRFEMMAPSTFNQPAEEGPTAQIAGAIPSRLLSPSLTSKGNGFTSLISKKEVILPVFLLSLLVAMFWGALHALTPGHGKTIVAAYLVGSRATFKHALFLGIPVTLTHTVSVFALGLLAFFASNFVLVEDLFPWIELTSGLMIILIGSWLLQCRSRVLISGVMNRLRAGKGTSTGAHGADHYAHDDAVGHAHDHSNSHPGHSHGLPSHNGEEVAWKRLLTVGIAGGLLPCPSAIVLMLSAIALDRVGFGLLLVVAFSLGLAGTLAGIGLITLYGGQMLGRFTANNKGVWARTGGFAVRLFPVGSAAIISAAGLLIILRAVQQL
jgi:ABC-type nickel/cobalt efflux system permease component RcnA